MLLPLNHLSSNKILDSRMLSSFNQLNSMSSSSLPVTTPNIASFFSRVARPRSLKDVVPLGRTSMCQMSQIRVSLVKLWIGMGPSVLSENLDWDGAECP
jgi:hypothetical protein